MNGMKVMSMSAKKVKLLDSLNLMEMPLRNIPKTFGIDELSKGYFPHLHNIAENQDYVGEYPAVEFYDPDGMLGKEMELLLTWYQGKKGEVFNFKEELLIYCKSDVRTKEGVRVI
jgi:hypothetical protein